MRTLRVGNDVVDLEQPRKEGRSRDERFMERVFDSEERASIRTDDDPDLELWARWAAKEAGFKVVSKLIGAPPSFVHRAFKVRWTLPAPVAPAEGTEIRRGRLSYQGYHVEISVVRGPASLHAVGSEAHEGGGEPASLHARAVLLDAPKSPWTGSLQELSQRLTARELSAVYSRASAAVRLGARADLARAFSVDEARLEIVCEPGPKGRRPPRVLLDGAPAAADVSLSHDGRWIAWVLWVHPNAEGT